MLVIVRIPMDINSPMCYLCRCSRAEFFCTCISSLDTFCVGCQDKHRAWPGIHHLLPLGLRGKILLEALPNLQNLLYNVENVKQALQNRCLQEFSICEQEINRKFATARELLGEEQRRRIQSLHELQAQVEKEITAAVTEIVTSFPYREVKPETELAALVLQQACQRNIKPISLLVYQIDIAEDSMQECVRTDIKVKIAGLPSDWRSNLGEAAYLAAEMPQQRSYLDTSHLVDLSSLAEEQETLPVNYEQVVFAEEEKEAHFADTSDQFAGPNESPRQFFFPDEENNWMCGFCGKGPYPRQVSICGNCAQANTDGLIQPHVLTNPRNQDAVSRQDIPRRSSFEHDNPQADSEEMQESPHQIPVFNYRLGMEGMQRPRKPS